MISIPINQEILYLLLDPTSLQLSQEKLEIQEFCIILRGENERQRYPFTYYKGGWKGPQVQLVVKNATFT